MGQFEEPIEFLRKNDKEALFKWCFNRCYQAFNVIYEYEKTKMGSVWCFDERFYEHGIQILYERFCYAMAIIVDQFRSEYGEHFDVNDTYEKTLSFQVFLGRAVDEVFKHGARDMGWDDTTMEYCDFDYSSEEYEKFWGQHRRLESQIRILRSSFAPDERTDLHGFRDDDEENWNLDCLYMMRVSQISGDVDVQKFLNYTKRHYLPTIIKAFMPPKPPWWQFWKR